MMLTIYENMARRFRIRSWKDLVLILGVAVLVLVIQYLLKHFLPNLSDKTVSVISYGIGFVIIIAGIFIVGD
ncbi:MAG: hypothetical protein IJN11_00375 [Oscillospiraceae bacterium]|nr:hypothetical protein [Oscillospiraceae bacterium]MBQ7012360.1 hypothetical protein [Oscillospiraceae bacterium]